MDPNACMAEILDLLAGEPKSAQEEHDVRDQLIERFQSMRSWLEYGGFLPSVQNARLLLAIDNLFHRTTARSFAAVFQNTVGGG